MKRLALVMLLASTSQAAKVGVIYSQNTGRVRCIIVPDKDSELDNAKLAPGEALHKVDKAQISDVSAAQASVSAVSGKVPSSDRYAVVSDTGAVVGAIIADPAIDSIKGFQLIQSDDAGPGWTYSADTGFTKPVSPIPLTHSDVVISK